MDDFTMAMVQNPYDKDTTITLKLALCHPKSIRQAQTTDKHGSKTLLCTSHSNYHANYDDNDECRFRNYISRISSQ